MGGENDCPVCGRYQGSEFPCACYDEGGRYNKKKVDAVYLFL